MFKIEESFDAQILAAQKDRPVVVLTEPLDGRILEAVSFLTRYVKPVLLAGEAEVRAAAARHLGHLDASRVEYTLSECAFVDVAGRSDLVEEFAADCLERHPHGCEASDLAGARAAVVKPGIFGSYAVHRGHADMVVGGAVHSPRTFFRPMLSLLANRPVVCQVGIFVLPDDFPGGYFPHNIVVFGDVGVNAVMTPEILAEVAVGTCAVARDLIPEDVLPEINGAIVSYSHKGSDEGPSPETVRQALELVPGVLEARARAGRRYASIRIIGEVKFSAAISRRSAELYGAQGLGGATNVIICPNLETGNLLYHLYAARFPEAKKFPVIFGLAFRGVDLAMDSTPEDIRLAIKASVLRLQRDGRWTRTPHDTFFRRHRVLVLNPGSTSTRVAVYEGDQEVHAQEVKHGAEELAPFAGRRITDQYELRKEAVLRVLAAWGLTVDDLDAVCGRGGLLRPIPHGTYRVSEAILEDLRSGVNGDHASNLGALIAHELAAPAGKPAFIVDPVVVDEAAERVKITGVKAIRRRVISHALNQVASARRFAQESETFYEKVNVVVCHMGGGISVGAHRQGRYVDVNNALDGEGPFSAERSGSLPQGQFAEMCFSGQYTHAEIKRLIKGAGGLVSLLGTSDLREVERRVTEGDTEAAAVFDALAYQVAKAAAALLPAFEGERLDRVILTGGMARSTLLVERLSRYLSGLPCGVTVYPGENELVALAKGALRVLYGKETAREYGPNVTV
ncbi:MAG TPA: butyrate kinase [Vicinamibacterales bacterium]|nr:butyrate kinase [Vicinamibacterales bacterium]